MQQRIAELEKVEQQNAELVAQVEVLRRELQSAADWFSAYWPDLSKSQCDCIRRMDFVAKSAPPACLSQIKADAAAEAVAECLRIVEQTKTSFNQLSRYHRGVDITPSKFKENAILELKRYAERVKAGEV
jgi:hypothetical protein